MERIKSEILNTIKRGPSRGLFKHKIRIEEKIYLEVPIFANLLETYFYDEEKFHGYLNSHYSTWINIFQDDFIRMIITYNLLGVEYLYLARCATSSFCMIDQSLTWYACLGFSYAF